jgi:hypothetical protein
MEQTWIGLPLFPFLREPWTICESCSKLFGVSDAV